MVKRILGGVGVVLGTIGVIFCLIVIIGAWIINTPITSQLLNLFTPVEDALVFADDATIEFNTFLDEQQERINSLDALDFVEIAAPELVDEIQQIRLYAQLATIFLRTADESLPDIVDTDALIRILNDAIGILDTTLDLAQQIIDAGGLDDLILNTINEQFDNIRDIASELQTAVDQVDEDVAEIKAIVPVVIDLISLLFTLLFAWFGIAQYNLLINSWGLVRQNGNELN